LGFFTVVSERLLAALCQSRSDRAKWDLTQRKCRTVHVSNCKLHSCYAQWHCPSLPFRSFHAQHRTHNKSTIDIRETKRRRAFDGRGGLTAGLSVSSSPSCLTATLTPLPSSMPIRTYETPTGSMMKHHHHRRPHPHRLLPLVSVVVRLVVGASLATAILLSSPIS